MKKPELPPGYAYRDIPSAGLDIAYKQNKEVLARIALGRGLMWAPGLPGNARPTWEGRFNDFQEALDVVVARLWLGEFE